MEQEQRALEFVMEAGRTLLENGAEVFRVQQTMEIMAQSLGVQAFGVYVLTNGIFASAGQLGEVRYLPGAQVHLGRVERVIALSRSLAKGEVGLEEAFARLAEIRALPAAPPGPGGPGRHRANPVDRRSGTERRWP